MKHHPALAICHLAFLAGIALYVGVFYPACGILAVLLVLASAAVEIRPRIFGKPLVPELLLGAAIAGTWWHWPLFATAGELYRAVGLVVAYLLLIPSRSAVEHATTRLGNAGSQPPGDRLKWLLLLAAAELVFGTRLPGNESAALIIIAIGLAALAVDTWLSACVAAQTGHPAHPSFGASVFRWAILPLLLVLSATTLIGPRVVEATADYHATKQSASTAAIEADSDLLDLQETMSLGDHRSLQRNPRIVARLTWESGSAPTGMIYLRALSLPDLVLSGPAIGWMAQLDGERQKPPAEPDPIRWAQVHRSASRSDVVLRSDETSAVELPDLVTDDAGNLYSAALKNREYTYRVGFDDRPAKADPALLQRCLEIDPRLDSLPWGQFEDPRWSRMDPEQAAASICSRLQSVCAYDLENLPLPMVGPGGVLRGFLFGSTPEARRGHCQYFATAAVLLLRRAGHPARCVGGLASNEIDPSGVSFRELHLHAWIEVVNSQGEWQRFDPSPESRMARILAGVQPPAAKDLSKTASDKENTAVSRNPLLRWPVSTSPVFWGMLLGGLAILGVLRCGRSSSDPRRPRDPRLAELHRRNHDLIEVAMSLGIVVTPATTLTDLVAALEARTGLRLGTPLRDHLIARFGNGPLPEPWPLAALSEAGKARTV